MLKIVGTEKGRGEGSQETTIVLRAQQGRRHRLRLRRREAMVSVATFVFTDTITFVGIEDIVGSANSCFSISVAKV